MTRNVIGMEISRSDVDHYNYSFEVNMANFGLLTEFCTARKEECPPHNFITLRSRLFLALLIESGSGATFAQLLLSSS